MSLSGCFKIAKDEKAHLKIGGFEMVGKMVKLSKGHSFKILAQGECWFANKVYSSISQAQAVMIEIMKAGNLSDCPIIAIGQDVV